jgi:hypothetical protein
MRRTLVHPEHARTIATYVIEDVWGELTDDYEQVQPGVFVSDDGALVVAGAAQVSEPGVLALRLTQRLWELAVVMYASGEPLIAGPRHLYAEDEWARIVTRMVALTRDVEAVFTTFEVAPMTTEQERADVGAVSTMIASAVPAGVDPDPRLLEVLMDQCDIAMREAA